MTSTPSAVSPAVGFMGAEYKADRKILLKNLTGSSAFKGGAPMLMNKNCWHLRETYPAGTRVELVRMDDVQAPPIGTHGTVYGSTTPAPFW